MSHTLLCDARIVPVAAPSFHGDLRITDGRISALGPSLPRTGDDHCVQLGGRVLMPGFVDAHTHALHAGERIGEFFQLLSGTSYLEILGSGGGIHATVAAVQAASEAELAESLERRLHRMLRHGTTTVEVKSGYGLTTAGELKMLRAIHRAAQEFPGTVVPTALLGHAIDPREPNFVDHVVQETLPAVHEEYPGISIDAFCEKGAWSVAQCRRLFEAALALGHPVRLHADQFSAQGGLGLALELGARSVDHLEATPARALTDLAQSSTFGVMLPVSAWHTHGQQGRAKDFLAAGGKLVLASNHNPGTGPCLAMPFVIALGVRSLGLTLPEALHACTVAPATLLGYPDRGHLSVGARADLVALEHLDERYLAFEVGANPVHRVWVNGLEVTATTSR